jgi:hypothetical protein
MATSWWNRVFKPTSRPPVRKRRPAFQPRVEELEARLQPAVFLFSTGLPDARAATISEPPNNHNGQPEFESADDFVLNTETVINRASFTGLLTGGASLNDVDNVFLTIDRVFPNDSDPNRTPQVPTRVNSPAAILGAYLGSRLAQRLDRRFIRWTVVGIGFALAGHFLIRRWVGSS